MSGRGLKRGSRLLLFDISMAFLVFVRTLSSVTPFFFSFFFFFFDVVCSFWIP